MAPLIELGFIMTKVYDWIKRNRIAIGFVAGISCLFNGILYMVYGNLIMGAFQFMLGIIILLDAWESNNGH